MKICGDVVSPGFVGENSAFKTQVALLIWNVINQLQIADSVAALAAVPESLPSPCGCQMLQIMPQ